MIASGRVPKTNAITEPRISFASLQAIRPNDSARSCNYMLLHYFEPNEGVFVSTELGSVGRRSDRGRAQLKHGLRRGNLGGELEKSRCAASWCKKLSTTEGTSVENNATPKLTLRVRVGHSADRHRVAGLTESCKPNFEESGLCRNRLKIIMGTRKLVPRHNTRPASWSPDEVEIER